MGVQTSRFILWGTTVNLARSKDTAPSEEELQEMDRNIFNPTHGFFDTDTGEKMHYLKYLPEGNTKPKGICIFQHGIGAYGGVPGVAKIARNMTKNGFAFYAPDLIGHGFSEGCRFYIPRGRWTINRDHLEAFAQFATSQHTPTTPSFLMGTSYGGCLTLHVARQWQDDPSRAPPGFSGVCLLCPAIIGDLPPAIVTFVLRYFFAALAPRWVPFFMPQTVSPARIWKDEAVRRENTSGRVLSMGLSNCATPFRLGTAVGLLTALEVVREVVIPGLTVPFAVAHGTEDYCVPIAGTDFLLERACTTEGDRAVRRVIGGYHDMLSEETSEETILFFIKWMDSRISKKIS